MQISYVVPLLMGSAFLIFGLVLPTLLPILNNAWKYGLLGVGAILLLYSCFIARTGSKTIRSRGGLGGKASATGVNADAVGGAGGNANSGIGGNGGNARATGKGSRAKGGAGGSG